MAGTKRPNAKTGSSDFKRLKAKVGKKVAKPANETDTTFKKASLYVAGQSDSIKAQSITSQKGRSISDLALQTSHPAAPARQSAIRGLLSILRDHSTSNVRAHLHLLIQIASKGRVDVDADVRKVSFSLLEEILKRNEKETLVPFISLLVAYTSSSLHSLEKDMRLDGAKTVNILCMFFCRDIPSEIANHFLPPFVGILAEYRQNGLQTVLDSLASLFECLLPQSSIGDQKVEMMDPDYYILNEAVGAKNAFVLHSKSLERHHCMESFCLKDVIGGAQSSEYIYTTEASRGAVSLIGSIAGIQKKLCDILLEILDDDGYNDRSASKRATFSWYTVTQTIRALSLARQYELSKSFKGQFEVIVTDQVRTLKLLRDMFPLTGEEKSLSGKVDAHAVETGNALLTRAMILFDLKTVKNDSEEWMSNVVEYWIGSKDEMSGIKVDILGDISRHCTRRGKKEKILKDKILHHLQSVLFMGSNIDGMRASASRRGTSLLVASCLEALKEKSAGISDLNSLTFTESQNLLQDLHLWLPTYLVAWSTDFEQETSYILRALIEFSRESNDLRALDILRQKMLELFTNHSDSKVPKLNLFEKYKPSQQQLILGVLRLLGKPLPSVVRILGRICAADRSAASLKCTIFDTMYSIRKTMRLTDYYTFLVLCLGVSKKPRLELGNNFRWIQDLDYRVLRSANAAMECGCVRSLNTLMPQLLKWSVSPEKFDAHVAADAVFRNRVALCFTARLMEGVPPDEMHTFDHLLECLSTSIHYMLLFISSDNIFGEERMLAPVFALGKVCPLFTKKVQAIDADNYKTKQLVNDGLQASILQMLSRVQESIA